jgi:small subunit ribosomal protein S17
MDKTLERKRITQTGIVVSHAMDKTVVVEVERRNPHPVYSRIVRRSNKFMCHDEQNVCQTGDKVRIIESRPLSKKKRWRVKEIVAKAR